MNANRQRAILAAQKVRVKTDPQPEEQTRLTAEERKAMYAPKSANTAPAHVQGNEWVRAWRTVEKITYGLTVFSAVLFGGLVAGESKKAIKK